MGTRGGLSTVLILGALVLVIAIFIGNNMGSRVLGQIATRGSSAVATPIPTPSASPADNAFSRALWKRRQVLSVATDPAFPDPRITPEPVVPRTPRPAKRTPSPSPTPSPNAFAEPSDAPRTPDTTYTSPPMPIPLVTHSAAELNPADATQSASPQGPAALPSSRPGQVGPGRSPANGRPYPSLPPVSQPTINP